MSTAPAPVRQKTVLVVDDEPELRKCVVRDFTRLGYTVFEAGNGNEALEIFLRHPVDAVLTDVRMPQGTGIYLLEEIRRRHPTIPVVFLITGYADIGESEAKGKGAYGIIEKPIDRKAMIAMVEKSLRDSA